MQHNESNRHQYCTALIWLEDTIWPSIQDEFIIPHISRAQFSYDQNDNFYEEGESKIAFLQYNNLSTSEDINSYNPQDTINYDKLIAKAVHLYTRYNNEFINDHLHNSCEIVYVSRLLPCIIVKTNLQTIEEYRFNKSIVNIDIIGDEEFINEFEDSIKVSGQYQVINDFNIYSHFPGCKGQNVTIGIIEARDKKGPLPLGEHAEIVKYEISHVAPYAKIQMCKTFCGPEDFLKKLDQFLIDYKCNIINVSAGFDYDRITRKDKYHYDNYVDYAIYRYNFIFTKSAGNHKRITSPGNSMNSIVVGNLETNEILYNTIVRKKGNFDIRDSSGYIQPTGVPLANKPDICAPGTNLSIPSINSKPNSGTSFAVAIVSGAIGQLLGAYPNLKNNYLLVKAIIILSASHNKLLPNPPIPDSSYIVSNSGFGLLDSQKLFNEINKIKFKEYLVDIQDFNCPIHENLGYVKKGSKITAVLLFERPVIMSLLPLSLPDLDLILCSSSGSTFDISASENNYEKLEYQFRYSSNYYLSLFPFKLPEVTMPVYMRIVVAWIIE